ncbi:GNAT family N-acetyltransferase [Phenylobacterium sp.]|uniref:GNAT family N-acetyltransferase n=1 Tax=Phenylobacterium sp. TaxID=1871053 RepID=UPI002735C818|nr:GNAT family N-acetyltransferase [Phenylobacterium sp.]MDP3852376.1 GNAT family N-acetyltransferase [Phenylobacterium sp.]
MAALDIRPVEASQADAVLALYKATAGAPGGLARRPDEIDLAYVRGFLAKASKDGVTLGAWDGGRLCGEIHASRIGPDQFAHVLSDLTVAVDPAFQGKGVGSALFRALFETAARLTPRVVRIELAAREGNAAAIALYQRLGFVIDGRFEKRVRMPDGAFEADIAMGLILPD